MTMAKVNSRVNAVPSLFAGRQWQQVLERDASADGQFFYAVKSTGIYCKPSCPSRRPTRKQVTFFPTPAAAEAAGYRPCLRCELAAKAEAREETRRLIRKGESHTEAQRHGEDPERC